jgi:hypothetical protein
LLELDRNGFAALADKGLPSGSMPLMDSGSWPLSVDKSFMVSPGAIFSKVGSNKCRLCGKPLLVVVIPDEQEPAVLWGRGWGSNRETSGGVGDPDVRLRLKQPMGCRPRCRSFNIREVHSFGIQPWLQYLPRSKARAASCPSSKRITSGPAKFSCSEWWTPSSCRIFLIEVKDFEAGEKYAQEQGWLEFENGVVRLTQKGFDEM